MELFTKNKLLVFTFVFLSIFASSSAKEYSPAPYNIKFDIPDNYYVITYDTNDKALFQKLNIDVATLKQSMLNEHILMACIDPKTDIEVDIIVYTDSNSRLFGDISSGKLSDAELVGPKFSKMIQAKLQLERPQLNVENIGSAKYLVIDGNVQEANYYRFIKAYITIKNGTTIGINGLACTPQEQRMFSDVKQIVSRIDYSHAENYTEQPKQATSTKSYTTTSNFTQNNRSSNNQNPFYKFLVGGILGGLAIAIRYLYEWFKNKKDKQ